MQDCHLICFPKGNNASFMSLKCCFPKGMPTIVIQKNIPHSKWVKAIQKPPTKNHIIFITRLRHPDEDSSSVIVFPNGHKANIPNLIHWIPKGIPIIVIIKARPANKYSTAIINPPNRNQIILPKVFILSYS